MDKWIEEKIAVGVLQGQEVTEARYYQERLRSAVLMELGRIDESKAIFDQIYATGGVASFSPHLIYTRLVQEGMYDDALHYIELDKARPVRASFWRGLVTRYKGDQARAKRIWEDAIKEESVRGDTESIVEHILTLYYLGDPKGEGLELMLRAQREQTRISWMIFLLTGIGWIVRGDNNAAHSNLRLALSQVKSMGEAKALPYQYWRFATDLAPAEKVAPFARYFDTRTETAPSESSAAATTGATE
jgi:hypothetical protein